jgi:Zn-dependent oligopeptidase
MKHKLTRLMLHFTVGSLLLFLVACSGTDSPSPSDLPQFENSAVALQKSFDEITTDANSKLAALAALDTSHLTFENSILVFEEIIDSVTLAANRAYVLKDVSPTPEIADRALKLGDKYTGWFNSTYNTGNVYKVLKAYADTNPALPPDAQKLLNDTLKVFQNNGISSEGVANPAVLALQNQISALQTQIEAAVTTTTAETVSFTVAELEGLTADALARLDRNDDQYLVQKGDAGTLRDVIMTFAVKEATREKAMLASSSQAQSDINLITDLASKRAELAKTLGYNNWADYSTATKMAKTGATASNFVNTVSDLLKPKMNAEISALMRYLQVGVNDDNGRIDSWDVYFFENLYLRDTAVDFSNLKQYFPYYGVLNGMFRVYERSFGLKIEFVENPNVWHKDVRLVKISNAGGPDDGKLLGYVYFDMFPRLAEGKYGHFETAGIIYGKTLPDGSYRKPVAALICSFPVDADGKPANLLYGDISILFHEFGHALHVVLGKARFASQSGFAVPWDFAEVPSTMSEQWRFDPAVFKLLAKPDPALTDAFVNNTIAAIKQADLAVKGLFYERQLALGKIDFLLHLFTNVADIPAAGAPDNLVKQSNDIMAATYLPFPDGSSYLTSFQHVLTWGYDAGYYSYAWSDSIVSELAAVFNDPANTQGYLNPDIGMRYRKEILEPGASRDVNDSVAAFTGHALDPTRRAFLVSLGITTP